MTIAAEPTLSTIGRGLSFADIEEGLRELNPGISFDAAVRRPSDNVYALTDPDEHIRNMREKATGIYHNGKYVCGVSRGFMPENDIYTTKMDKVEIPMSEVDRHDEVRIAFMEVPKTDPNYNSALLKAEKGDDNFDLRDNGKVFLHVAYVEGQVPDKIIQLGWRPTFERLIAAKIPGITRRTLSARFGVTI